LEVLKVREAELDPLIWEKEESSAAVTANKPTSALGCAVALEGPVLNGDLTFKELLNHLMAKSTLT